MKWNACVDHSDSPARINLVVKVFLYFLIILSPTHNHASLEMSDEPEGLPVRDEVASIVTMLQCYMLHVTLRVRLTSSLHHPKKNRSSITPQRECKFLCDFLYRAARFVRFLVEWYKSAISSAFPPVSPKVKIKMLIIIYLQGLLQKAAKSGRM